MGIEWNILLEQYNIIIILCISSIASLDSCLRTQGLLLLFDQDLAK